MLQIENRKKKQKRKNYSRNSYQGENKREKQYEERIFNRNF
jgi:hypothetical protein